MKEIVDTSRIEKIPVADTMQKYYNYREQMGRLKKSLKNQFYLEAIFIDYSIMEDRLESILRHAGLWENMLEKERKHKNRDEVFIGIDAKIRKVKELSTRKPSLENRYFSDELMDSIRIWKDDRNPLTHSLLKLQLHTKDLEDIAFEGEDIAKKLCSKSTSYRRMIDKDRQSIDL